MVISSDRGVFSQNRKSAVWALSAAWERLVVTRTPDANIRADLLVIWPTVWIISIWFGI
jgi:hypothetical protein